MRRRKFRANSTEVNKSPIQVRYVFITYLTEVSACSDISIVTTYRHMKTNVDSGPIKVLIVDLKNSNLIILNTDYLSDFIEEWRDNYYNYDWEVPNKFIKIS